MKEKTLLYYTDKGELLTFENYTINEKGIVKNKKTGKALKTKINKKGRESIGLINDNKRKFIFIYRAMLSTFKTDKYFKGADVNHIDENIRNNNINNLEWLSRKDNLNYGTRNDRASKKLKGNKNNKGRRKKVLCYDLNDNFIKEYESGWETQKDGFTPSSVYQCCNGKLKTHKNHKFYYRKG